MQETRQTTSESAITVELYVPLGGVVELTQGDGGNGSEDKRYVYN